MEENVRNNALLLRRFCCKINASLHLKSRTVIITCAIFLNIMITSSAITVVQDREQSGNASDVVEPHGGDEEPREERRICPSLDQYEEVKNSPNVSVINATHLLVDWSHLWSDTKWRDCISKLQLMLDGDEIKTVPDVMANSSELEVNPCENHSIKVKITLVSTDLQHVYSTEEIINPPGKMAHEIRSKIHEYIIAKHNEVVQASYFKTSNASTNISCVRIMSNLSDLIEEQICNRVTLMELVFRKEGKTAQDDWTKTKQIKPSKRDEPFSSLLDEVICGLSDFCAVYEIGLRIVETTLPASPTTDVVIPLTSIGPVGSTDLERAQTMGITNVNMEGPNDLELLYAKPNSIALQWNNKKENNCISGYMIKVKNHNELDKLGICTCYYAMLKST